VSSTNHFDLEQLRAELRKLKDVELRKFVREASEACDSGRRWFETKPTAPDRRSTQSGRDVRQPNRVLANGIGGNKAERRPRADKEWLAATKHDGVEVESILINKTKVG
jgi:hypothetical protein